MSDKINGRTPEEIKKGLECCSVDGLSCSNCSYCVSCDADIHALERDALAYIQQLERERDAAVDETESLRAEIDAINEDYLRGIHTVREDAQPKWISVEERLPEDDLPENSDVKVIKVFVAIKGKNRTTLRTQTRNRRTLFDTRGEPFFDWEWRYSSGNVTHWMPLPEPPKEE